MSKKPTPVNEEMSWDKTKTIKSQTDNRGIISYVNNVFEDVSEYSKEELIGKPHNVVRHPDMPKVIFKLLWENLQAGSNFNAIVKNMTKSGKYYWIVTNFDIFKDPSGAPTSFLGVRSSVPDSVLQVIEPLYKELLEKEKSNGIESSEAHLNEFLKDKGLDYNAFVQKVMADNGVNLQF